MNFIQYYWQILFSVFVLTGIGYFYLMRIKKRAMHNYYNVSGFSSWTYETRHQWINNMPWYFKLLLGLQLIVFLVLDWLLNILLTIPMLDLPETVFELTTHRMKRYKKYEAEISVGFLLSWREQYRYNFAVFICKLLNRGENDHC